MEVDKDEYILEITSDPLEREAESGGGERSQKRPKRSQRS
jgi:hypothetical protein